MHDCPCLLGRVNELHELKVTRRNDAFFDQRFEIYDAVPEFTTEHSYRHRLDLPGLDQREQLERLVESAKPAGEHGHSPRTQQKVHFA